MANVQRVEPGRAGLRRALLISQLRLNQISPRRSSSYLARSAGILLSRAPFVCSFPLAAMLRARTFAFRFLWENFNFNSREPAFSACPAFIKTRSVCLLARSCILTSPAGLGGTGGVGGDGCNHLEICMRSTLSFILSRFVFSWPP